MNEILTHNKSHIEHMYYGGQTYYNAYVDGSYMQKPNGLMSFTGFGFWKWYTDNETILMLYCII